MSWPKIILRLFIFAAWTFPAMVLHSLSQIGFRATMRAVADGIREGLANRRYWLQRTAKSKRDGVTPQDVQDALKAMRELNDRL